MNTTSQPATVIFHHIPKTAGTTMLRILDEVVPAGETFTVPGRNEPGHAEALRRLRTLPDEERRSIRLLRGHDVFGFHRHLPQSATYFTILRDPARRLVSSYHHLRGAPARLPERKVWLRDPPTLAEYVESGDIYLGRNSQLKTFIGYDPVRHGDATEAELLEEATRALQERYALVGLTERFDETVLLCGPTFGWHPAGYERRNVSPRYDRSETDPAILERYRELNPADVTFYARARALFEDRLQEAFGDGIGEALAAFRRSNRWYRRRKALRRGLARTARVFGVGR